MTEKVYFSIGSNLGDRAANIMEALDRMDRALGRHWSALSDLIETEPWGFDGADFVNAAVMYELDSDPWTVLDVCKGIERAMGREETVETDSDGKRVYHDRVIDIDILLYGDRRVQSENLTIPHPLMTERDFVMRPLRQILPQVDTALRQTLVHQGVAQDGADETIATFAATKTQMRGKQI